MGNLHAEGTVDIVRGVIRKNKKWFGMYLLLPLKRCVGRVFSICSMIMRRYWTDSSG